MSIEPTRSRHLGKYELQTLLGRGGMAEVWQAFDPQLRRHVAIKLMLTELKNDPDFLVRFEREARLVASLDHPNIVRIHDFHISQPPESETPTPYMVMDYVKGQTLSDYINSTSRKGQIPSWSDIVYLFAVTSRALDYAHQKGMVHRDIKPANILLDQRLPTPHTMGEPILTDFGVARMQGVQTGTVLGSLIGTPMYIAPEQALGNKGDRRCDLYSLGIILYEMTTGITPFRADTSLAIIMQHIHEVPTSPALINPQIPPAVSAVILKSIAKSPEDRYFSATDMTMALAQALNIPLPGRSASVSSAGYTPLPGTSFPLPSPGTAGGASSTAGYNMVRAQEHRNPTLTPPYSSPEVRPVSTPPGYTPYFGFVPVGSEQTYIHDTQRSRPSRFQLQSRRGRVLLFSILFLLLLLIGGAGILALQTTSTPPAAGPAPITGHVVFFHSATAAIGNYDQIKIDISNVPPPPQGYVYYAWLVSNTLENSPAHWKLAYTNATLHLNKQSYTGHANLLKAGTLFLVTKESVGSSPAVPYTDPQARLYYAQIPNASLTSFDIKSCPTSSTTNICRG
jgi:eukaryotic-like serine/threonine-protein kinase